MKTEGRNAVLELLKTDKTIEKIMLEKGAQGTLGKIFAEARRKGVRVQFVDRAVLDKESATGRHQGVIAVTTAFEYSALEELFGGENSLIVLCDGIEDVHNLGSILRVAECAGADGVVIPNAKGATVTEAVMRISAGAAEHVKVAKVPSVNRAVEELQKAGYKVIETLLLPDDMEKIKAQLIRLSDQRQVNLILTTGGTGFSERDCTPEATLAVATRNAPGIAEAIRAGSMQITRRAMLSREASVIRHKTLIVNLPGSPKAVKECLDLVLDQLDHGIRILTGRDKECARK